MTRNVVIAFAAAAVLVPAFAFVAGYRIVLSGDMSPRIGVRDNYNALEADRARQRAEVATANPNADAGSNRVRPTSGAPGVERTPLDPPTTSDPPSTSAPPGPSSAIVPEFRGPNRDGRYDVPIRINWPREGLRPMWKQPIGLGYASFVAADGRAFTIEQRRRQEVVAAYDIQTGREIWTHGWDGEFTESIGGDGPRATPTYHDGRVYALGGLGEFQCLDASTGDLIWRRNILTDARAPNLEWGMSAAPLIVDDNVIVLPGGFGGHSVVAYNRMTGDIAWSALDDQAAYTSPMLVTLGGIRQLLIVSASRAFGLAADGSRLLWEYPWETEAGINVAQPLLLGNDRVFLSAGYGHGAAVIQLERTSDSFKVRTVWQNLRMKNKFTSSVLRDGYIYGLDENILACVDATTGALKWKGGRYGYGQLLLAGDHLVVISEDGQLALVKAEPDRYAELATFSAIDGKTWNHPIIVGGTLLVRNGEEMAAFDVTPR